MYSPTTSSPNHYARRNPTSSNFVDKTGKFSQDHQISHRNSYSEVRFTPIHHRSPMEADDSGVISPPLWKSSPSPPRSPSRPLLGGDYQPYSPDSRAQAIARGRSELMEMVSRMPESSYELSLRDIVEYEHRGDNQSPGIEDDAMGEKRGAAVGLRKAESRRFDRRSSFEDKGMFLNMVFPFPFPFPFSFRSKKKKKVVGGNSGRVSPKPEGLKVGDERDWWKKKKFTGSSDSDSSKISDNSGGGSSSSSATTTVNSSSSGSGGRSRSDSRGRGKNGFTCWQIFHLRRSKSA